MAIFPFFKFEMWTLQQHLSNRNSLLLFFLDLVLVFSVFLVVVVVMDVDVIGVDDGSSVSLHRLRLRSKLLHGDSILLFFFLIFE